MFYPDVIEGSVQLHLPNHNSSVVATLSIDARRSREDDGFLTLKVPIAHASSFARKLMDAIATESLDSLDLGYREVVHHMPGTEDTTSTSE